MTKSFLIKTSVAAIVSAFVFTAGVSSARAGGDSYREAPSNGGPLYYPNRDTGGITSVTTRNVIRATRTTATAALAAMAAIVTNQCVQCTAR